MRIKTEDVTLTKGKEFEDFDLDRDLLKGIYEMGFEKPSPIQEEAIRPILEGRNIMARAKNGTGKTGAFSIPSIQRVDTSIPHVQVLIIVPTRELAVQHSSVVKKLSTNIQSMKTCLITGGTQVKDDTVRLMKTNHIIVATPGRILYLAQQKIADLSHCKLIVLDEADKLLAQDFVSVIESIFRFASSQKQILLFSATFPLTVKSFCDK